MGLLDNIMSMEPEALSALSQGLLSGRGFAQGAANGMSAYGQAMNAIKQRQLLEEEARSKMALQAAQLQDVNEQAALRRAQAGKLSDAQATLAGIIGNGGAPSQYGIGGGGMSLGGVSERMQPRAGGLQGATLEQMLALKAAGIDGTKEWELANGPGQKVEQGTGYMRNGVTTWTPDMKAGTLYANGRLGVIPGAESTLGGIAGATKGAETEATEAAKARYDLVPVMRNGVPTSVTKAQFLLGQPGQSEQSPQQAQPSGSVDDATRALRLDAADKWETKAKVATDPNVKAYALQQAAELRRAADVGGAGMATPSSGTTAGAGGKGAPGFWQTGMSSDEKIAAAAKEANDVGVAKDIVEWRKGAMTADFNAPSQINKLTRIKDLLASHDGGSLSATGKEIASAFNSMGIKIDGNLPNKEAGMVASQEIALGLKNSASGNAMPGSFSDGDRNYLNSMAPGISQSAEGRAKIIEAQIAVLQRQKQVASFMRNYEKKHGRLDNGFFDQLSAWSAKNNMFGE